MPIKALIKINIIMKMDDQLVLFFFLTALTGLLVGFLLTWLIIFKNYHLLNYLITISLTFNFLKEFCNNNIVK